MIEFQHNLQQINIGHHWDQNVDGKKVKICHFVSFFHRLLPITYFLYEHFSTYEYIYMYYNKEPKNV